MLDTLMEITSLTRSAMTTIEGGWDGGWRTNRGKMDVPSFIPSSAALAAESPQQTDDSMFCQSG